MRVPRLRDFFALSSHQELISNEEHTVPASSPYVIFLDQLPKVNTSATGVLTNVWSGVTMASGLISFTIETSPGTWESVSLTDTTPDEGEAYLFLTDSVTYPFVPCIQFHSSAAGLAVKASYTGLGSVPLASYVQTLFDEVETLITAGEETSVFFRDNAGVLEYSFDESTWVDVFPPESHTHDTLYAALSHTHDALYSALSHTHDTLYAALSHTHPEYEGSALVIESDTTYYLDADTGDDTTGDGSSGTPWASLSHAIDVLRSYRIPSGVTVTVQLADGTYTETATISDVFHEGTLKIQGEHLYVKSMTSVQSSSGSAGAYSIVLSVDNITNVTTDDYAIIPSASGGTNPEYLLGCWAITNVDIGNSRITVTSTNEAGVPSGAVTATVAIMKARVAFTGVTGFSDVELTFDDLVIVGDGTALTNGCENLRRTLTFESLVGVVGFGNNGVRVGALGRVDATGLVCSGNATGILSWINGVVVTDSCVFSGNANYGVFGIRRGIVYCTSSQIYGNGTTDIYAVSVGYIYLSSSNYDSVSPAINTQGNEYAYIDG